MNKWISVKLGGRIKEALRTDPLNFGVERHKRDNPGILIRVKCRALGGSSRSKESFYFIELLE